MQDYDQGRPREIYTQRISNKVFMALEYLLIALLFVIIIGIIFPSGKEGAVFYPLMGCMLFIFVFHQYASSNLAVEHDPDTDIVTISDNGAEMARMKVDLSSEKRYLNRVEYPISEVLTDIIPFKYRHSIVGPRRNRLMINRFFLKRC